MKKRTRVPWQLLIACLLPAVLSGCLGAGRPIEFYALTPLAPPVAVPAGAPSAVVAVHPAVIPAVIDRPQIVTRTGENQLVLAEFNRWGGSLKEEVSRVLTVSDDDIRDAMMLAWHTLRLLIEPSSATVIAAVRSHRELFGGRRVGAIISGGNIDPADWLALTRGDSGGG